MASRRAELAHQTLLDKLLANIGFECLKTPSEVSEHILYEEVLETPGPPIEEELPSQEFIEEENINIEEEIKEHLPDIFPSPSLRKVLPERIRKYEQHNRIHVLPEQFKTHIDPQAIPRIATTSPKTYIDTLADLVGCTMYKTSLPEYWFLDTMANLLRRAQQDNLHRPSQAILMLWFCEWMKEVQMFDAADRMRMLRRFKDNMLAAATYIAEVDNLPTPAQAGVYYLPIQVQTSIESKNAVSQFQQVVSFQGKGYVCSLMDLTSIIHYIYDLSDYQFDLVQDVFTLTQDYILIDAPEQLQIPKRLYVKLKPLKEKPSKKEPKGKGKAVPDPEAYIHLMEVKAAEQKALAEKSEEDREIWNRKKSILPLSFATTDEFFDKYWPPTPSITPVVVDEVEPKPGKKKK